MHDKSMGGEGTETETRPGGDEWPGWYLEGDLRRSSFGS